MSLGRKDSNMRCLQQIEVALLLISVLIVPCISLAGTEVIEKPKVSEGVLSRVSDICGRVLTLSSLRSSQRQRVKLLPESSELEKQGSKDETTRRTDGVIDVDVTAIPKSQEEISFFSPSLLQRIYRQSRYFIGNAKLNIERFIDLSYTEEEKKKHESVYSLVERLFGPMSQEPLSEEIRKSLLNDPETRDILRSLEVHVDRLFLQVQREEEISSVHRDLIRILVDIIWKFRGGGHLFVQEAMSLIEKLNTPAPKMIQMIGVFQQAIILHSMRSEVSIEEAIDLVLGYDFVLQTRLKNSYLVETPSNLNRNVTQEMLLVTYLHLGQRINEVRKSVKLEPTEPSLQTFQEKLQEISPPLRELSSIFTGFWFLDQIGRIGLPYEVSSLLDSEIKEPLENLLNYVSSVIQVRLFTDIEAVFLGELAKAIAFGGISHPFIQDSIKGFVNRPTTVENMKWSHQTHSTTLHRIAVLQQTDRYYQGILHRRADYTQILDLVLEYNF